MSFYIFDSPDEALRIKSFSSPTKGEKGTIRIEIECSDLDHLAYALRSLAKTQKEQRRKPEKPVRQKPLALPAIRLALPAPEDDL